jgi:hypothetical protein
VSSNWFAAKSVEQMRVEQSQFEQFTPTLFVILVSTNKFGQEIFIQQMVAHKSVKN